MSEIVEKELSYKLTGICYRIHNNLSRFLTEKQYADAFEQELIKEGIAYERESDLSSSKTVANKLKVGRPDFVILDRVVVDLKAKKFITKADYSQMLKYLYLLDKRLGLIVNFHSTYLKPKRILNNKHS